LGWACIALPLSFFIGSLFVSSKQALERTTPDLEIHPVTAAPATTEAIITTTIIIRIAT
jgi:hypothetical protein